MPSRAPRLNETSKDEWETPPWLFRALDTEFDFTLDPCAAPHTAKCKKFYTKEMDGLAQDWVDEIMFINPPYSNIDAWYEAATRRGSFCVMLLPVAPNTDWFSHLIRNPHAEIRFLRKRVSFLLNGEEQRGTPFASMIVVVK